MGSSSLVVDLFLEVSLILTLAERRSGGVDASSRDLVRWILPLRVRGFNHPPAEKASSSSERMASEAAWAGRFFDLDGFLCSTDDCADRAEIPGKEFFVPS
jgi:hypothetical protein